MRRAWPDWAPCNFIAWVEGQDCHVVEYRRIDCIGINRALYEFKIERDGAASLVVIEMRRVPRSAAGKDEEPW